MKNRFRIVTAVVTALVLVSSVASRAARSHPLDEDAALALLVRTLKHDRVYAKRISLDCITYDTEETTDAYFSLPFAKSTTPNAVETPRRVRSWTAIAFIAASRKSNGGNRPTTSGDLTTQ